MKKLNFIDEEIILLERPNIREECNINSDEEMRNYLIAYNTYNNLLLQFLTKEFYLKDVDEQLDKHKNTFKPISEDDMDLYQSSSIGYFNYFYLRNNIYIERLEKDSIEYLHKIYQSGNLDLDSEKEQFIKNTYLKTILEEPDSSNKSINYGPDNGKFIKPTNAIIIGVRYDQFNNLENNNEAFNIYANREGQLQVLTDFLEYKVKKNKNIPFCVIKYDEYSVHSKKKINNTNIR